MPIVGLEDLVTPAAFVLSQACQAAVAIVLSMPQFGWPDLDAIAVLLSQVPAPETYADGLQSAALLYRFLERAATEIHARVHGGTIPASCLFDASRYLGWMHVDQAHPDSWKAASVFAAWSATFMGGLTLHHRKSVADRAIERLRARRGTCVNASDLAREVGCSVPVLHRAFSRATGRSMRQYAIQLRVDRAIELLQQTDWKVEAIAREVGWKSKKDLHVALARRVGATPTDVRRCGPSRTIGGSERHQVGPLQRPTD